MSDDKQDLLSRREWLGRTAAGVGAMAMGALADAGAAAQTDPQKPFAPTGEYTAKQIEGWQIKVHGSLLKDHAPLYARMEMLLRFQLYQITRVVPERALASLRRIPIWAEFLEPHHPCMVYHPSTDWLREHGMNPEKAGCVEIANATTFLAWTHDQPWMALHELAHAYHDRVLGFENAAVNAAYQAAVESKSYESVLRISGRVEKHYALTNSQEYFAEGSEAYFGTNDFYPFVRAELQKHDPAGYKMLQEAWNPVKIVP